MAKSKNASFSMPLFYNIFVTRFSQVLRLFFAEMERPQVVSPSLWSLLERNIETPFLD